MTTLQYILAWAGFCVACVACYAVGYAEGRKQGELDGSRMRRRSAGGGAPMRGDQPVHG